MKVDLLEINLALKSIIEAKAIDLFLDANFFIPPDRTKFGVNPYSFESFKAVWLEPLFELYAKLHIHESINDELINGKVRNYVDGKIGDNCLIVCKNDSLNEQQTLLMDSMIGRLSKYSKYDPSIDTSSDRGEVVSLSYMSVKGYTYFGAHDALPIRLIKNAEELQTGLEDMSVIQMYEIIYLLYKNGYEAKGLRQLYKYQYYLTAHEKRTNPSWAEFISGMDEIYGKYFID